MTIGRRITEWVRLAVTLKGHLVQSPCSDQRHLQLEQVGQSLMQFDLECFQGWGIYHIFRQLAPVLHHHIHKKSPPYVQSEEATKTFYFDKQKRQSFSLCTPMICNFPVLLQVQHTEINTCLLQIRKRHTIYRHKDTHRSSCTISCKMRTASLPQPLNVLFAS